MTIPTSGSDIARLVLDQAPDAIIVAGTDGAILEWNSAAEQIFGHSREEAMGQSLDLIIPERFREAHWRAYDAALESGKTKLKGKAMPTRSMRKDGETIYVELSFGVVLDNAGASIGAMAVARDITEKFLAERAKRDAAK
jgi:PAS domain S-box-containing protein